MNVQVNLVCGGWDDGANILSSCEMNIAGTAEWIMTTPLPLALGGLRGVTLEGRVLMTGETMTSDQLVAGIKLTFFLTLVVNFALSVLRLFECTSQVDHFKG